MVTSFSPFSGIGRLASGGLQDLWGLTPWGMERANIPPTPHPFSDAARLAMEEEELQRSRMMEAELRRTNPELFGDLNPNLPADAIPTEQFLMSQGMMTPPAEVPVPPGDTPMIPTPDERIYSRAPGDFQTYGEAWDPRTFEGSTQDWVGDAAKAAYTYPLLSVLPAETQAQRESRPGSIQDVVTGIWGGAVPLAREGLYDYLSAMKGGREEQIRLERAAMLQRAEEAGQPSGALDWSPERGFSSPWAQASEVARPLAPGVRLATDLIIDPLNLTPVPLGFIGRGARVGGGGLRFGPDMAAAGMGAARPRSLIDTRYPPTYGPPGPLLQTRPSGFPDTGTWGGPRPWDTQPIPVEGPWAPVQGPVLPGQPPLGGVPGVTPVGTGRPPILRMTRGLEDRISTRQQLIAEGLIPDRIPGTRNIDRTGTQEPTDIGGPRWLSGTTGADPSKPTGNLPVGTTDIDKWELREIAFKAYHMPDDLNNKQIEKLRILVRNNISGSQLQTPAGKDAIKARIRLETRRVDTPTELRPKGKVTGTPFGPPEYILPEPHIVPEFNALNTTAQAAEEFIDMLPEELLQDLVTAFVTRGDVFPDYLDIGPGTAGFTARNLPGSMLGPGRRPGIMVNVIKSVTNASPEAERTFIHEVVHHLSNFVPEEDMSKIISQWRRDRQTLGRTAIARAEQLKAEQSGIVPTSPVIGGVEDIAEVGVRGTGYKPPRRLTARERGLVNKAYRYTDFDEFFAEVLADRVLIRIFGYIPEYRSVIQRAIDLIRRMYYAAYNFLTRKGHGDEAERILNNLIEGKYNPEGIDPYRESLVRTDVTETGPVPSRGIEAKEGRWYSTFTGPGYGRPAPPRERSIFGFRRQPEFAMQVPEEPNPFNNEWAEPRDLTGPEASDAWRLADPDKVHERSDLMRQLADDLEREAAEKGWDQPGAEVSLKERQAVRDRILTALNDRERFPMILNRGSTVQGSRPDLNFLADYPFYNFVAPAMSPSAGRRATGYVEGGGHFPNRWWNYLRGHADELDDSMIRQKEGRLGDKDQIRQDAAARRAAADVPVEQPPTTEQVAPGWGPRTRTDEEQAQIEYLFNLSETQSDLVLGQADISMAQRLGIGVGIGDTGSTLRRMLEREIDSRTVPTPGQTGTMQPGMGIGEAPTQGGLFEGVEGGQAGPGLVPGFEDAEAARIAREAEIARGQTEMAIPEDLATKDPREMTPEEFASEFERLEERVKRAEKEGPMQTEAEREMYWKDFSRMRGYTEEEIADYERLMSFIPMRQNAQGFRMFAEEYESLADMQRALIEEGRVDVPTTGAPDTVAIESEYMGRVNSLLDELDPQDGSPGRLSEAETNLAEAQADLELLQDVVPAPTGEPGLMGGVAIRPTMMVRTGIGEGRVPRAIPIGAWQKLADIWNSNNPASVPKDVRVEGWWDNIDADELRDFNTWLGGVEGIEPRYMRTINDAQADVNDLSRELDELNARKIFLEDKLANPTIDEPLEEGLPGLPEEIRGIEADAAEARRRARQTARDVRRAPDTLPEGQVIDETVTPEVTPEAPTEVETPAGRRLMTPEEREDYMADLQDRSGFGATQRILGEGGEEVVPGGLPVGPPGGAAGMGPPAPPAGKPPPGPIPEDSGLISDPMPVEDQLEVAFNRDRFRRMGEAIDNVPGLRWVLRVANPSAHLGKTVVGRISLVRAQMRDEGRNKVSALMNRAQSLGTQEEIFGKSDPTTGLLIEGPFKGSSVNEIAENISKYKVNPTQKEWIERMGQIEGSIFHLYTRHGIGIGRVPLEAIERFAGRIVVGRQDPKTGEFVEIGFIESGRGKTGAEKARTFETATESQAEGFVYMPYEQAVRVKANSAWNRVVDEEITRWLVDNTPEGVFGTTQWQKGKTRAGEYPTSDDTPPLMQTYLFSGNGAREFVGDVNKIYASTGDSYGFLKKINSYNSVQRVYALAGDASIFFIQMILMPVSHPIILGKSIGNFGEIFARSLMPGGMAGKGVGNLRISSDWTSPGARRVRAEFLDEHREILQKIPIIMSDTGLEVTEALGKGGALAGEKGVSRIFGKVGGYLKPFQQAYESSIDTAGVLMAEALEPLAKGDPTKLRDLKDYIDNMRGLASARRTGVSDTQMLLESTLLLAPRYRRATAALTASLFQGGLRGKLAREAYLKAAGALVLTYTALTIYKGMSEGKSGKEITSDVLNGLNPTSSQFLMWKLGNQMYGPGSKFISDIRMLSKLATYVPRITGKEVLGMDIEINEAEDFLNIDEFNRNPAVRWVRSQLAGAPSLAWDLISGKNYIGEPISLDFTGDPMQAMKDLGERFSQEITPLWVHSMLFDGGTRNERLARGGVEFVGGRAYSASFYARADEVSKSYWGNEYEHTHSWQKDLVRLDPDVASRETKRGSVSERIKNEDERRIQELKDLTQDDARSNKYLSFLAINSDSRGYRRGLFGDEFEPDDNTDHTDPNIAGVAKWWEVEDHPDVLAEKNSDKKDRIKTRLRNKLRLSPEQLRYVEMSKHRRPVPGSLLKDLGPKTANEMQRAVGLRVKEMKKLNIPQEAIDRYLEWIYVGETSEGQRLVPTQFFPTRGRSRGTGNPYLPVP